jgi:hypothetical protein
MVRRRASTSPLVQSKVRGIFPTEQSVGVIPLGWVEQAMARGRDWADSGADPETIPGRFVLGIDVAYSGEDETCFAHRHGDVVTRLDRFRIADTVETANAAAAYLHRARSVAVVDVLNIGAGVFDQLRRWKVEGRIEARAIAFNASGGSTRLDHIGAFKFRNNRAAAWWNLRDKLDPSKGSRICLPNDERLKEELVTVKYEHQGAGVIKIESKDEIRRRMGRSTDSADAVIQSFWIPGETVNLREANLNWRASDPAEQVRAGIIPWEGYSPINEATFAAPGEGRGARNALDEFMEAFPGAGSGW